MITKNLASWLVTQLETALSVVVVKGFPIVDHPDEVPPIASVLFMATPPVRKMRRVGEPTEARSFVVSYAAEGEDQLLDAVDLIAGWASENHHPTIDGTEVTVEIGVVRRVGGQLTLTSAYTVEFEVKFSGGL